MDFVERAFHISPDGGTGVLELSIIFGLLVITFAAIKMWRGRHPSRGFR